MDSPDQPSVLLNSPLPPPKNDSLTLEHFHRLTQTQEQEQSLSNGKALDNSVKLLNRIQKLQLARKKVRSVNCSGLDSVRMGLATPDPSTKVKSLRRFMTLAMVKELRRCEQCLEYSRFLLCLREVLGAPDN